MQLINPNCPSKNGVKHIKINKEKLSQSDIFYPSAEKPDPNNRVKMQQKLLFTIKLTFAIELSGFDLFSIFFLKSP